MPGKTILVTGGGGYIASHCILQLLLEDFNVIAVDNFINCIKDVHDSGKISKKQIVGPKALPESLVRVQKLTNKSLIFYPADLTKKDSLREVFSQHSIDCVIHFAALKAVGESCRLPLMYYGNNITGSANIMEVMMELE